MYRERSRPGLYQISAEERIRMRLATTSFPPRARLPLHARPVSYLSLVLAGSYLERVGRETVDCRPLSLRFHSADEEHAHVLGDSGAECLNIELDEDWTESLRLLTQSARPVHVASAGRLGIRFMRCLHQRTFPDPGLADLLAADLLELCERQLGFERAAAGNVRIRHAIEMIEDTLPLHLSLARVAAAVGLHPTHLARSFKRATGLTIGGYIRKRRRECAEALLTQCPALTISRVAAESGFSDHAHLTRTFKADLGVAPSGYRAALL